MTVERRNVFRIIRDFLFSDTNREFLIFLFFLMLSGVFWLSLTLNESFETELALPVRIVNVPKDIMLTSDETDTVKVTVRDKGILLMAYKYGDLKKTINYNFKNGDKGGGSGVFSAADLQRVITQRLSSSAKIIGIKPDHINYYYNTGTSKRVPVRWSGRVIPEQLYFLSHVAYSPDTVTVYASEEKLDSIRMAYTEPLNYVNFRDTLNVDCHLKKIEGVKMVPDRVKVSFFTDVLTEESIDDVPIQGINLPKGKVLRTFPAKVRVNFVTGVNVYRSLKPADFVVVADYNELKAHTSEKCNIYLRQSPPGITRATLAIKQVDYLIEEGNE
jgi:hypothetical protein